MRLQPAQTYFPRAKVKLIVRFEDFGAHTPPTPQKPPHLRGGKSVDNKSKLQVTKDGSGWRIGPAPDGTKRGGAPQVQTSSSDGRTFVIDRVIPVRATLLRNGVRVADTLSLTLRYLDFPFDPRTVRSCAVQFYLGTLTEAQYRDEISGASRVVLPETFTDNRGRSRSNLRFEGWVDEQSDEWDDDGEPLVTLECTDNTRLVLDQEAPPKLTVAADQPIDKALANYLANFPQCSGLTVEYRPEGATIPTLKTALAKTAYRPQLGPPPSGGAGGASGGGGAAGGGGSKLMVWDYLTDVAGALGLSIRMEGRKVILQRPRTLYASKFEGRPDDPFTGRILPDGRNVTARLFVYGQNVTSFGFKRKFSKFSATNVEVRCFSAKQGKTLAARFPGAKKGDRQPNPKPGDANDEQWKVITVNGIEDEATLRAIAQGVYESIGRNEFSGRFSTKNLASFGGGPEDPDVLDCQAGDAIELEVARAVDGQTTVGAAADKIANRAQSYLTQLGFDADLAGAYAKAVSKIGMTGTYRVKTLSIDWESDTESGGEQGAVTLDFEVVNFLEVRASKNLPAGEEIEPTAKGNATPDIVRVEDDGTPAPQPKWI